MVTVQFNFKTILEAQEFLAEMTHTVSGPDKSQLKLSPADLGYKVAPAQAAVLNPEATAFVHTGTADLLGGTVAPAKSPEPKSFEDTVRAVLAPAPEKKKRGPKPKAAAPAVVTAGLQGTALPDVIYGVEDCRTALSNLFDVKGREVAKSVLTEFKVDRVTYLKPEQFAAFIGRCEAASKPE